MRNVFLAFLNAVFWLAPAPGADDTTFTLETRSLSPYAPTYLGITGAGAFLQQFMYGFTGLRLSEKGLVQEYTPMLPSGVKRLALRNVTVRGRRKDIEIQK